MCSFTLPDIFYFHVFKSLMPTFSTLPYLYVREKPQTFLTCSEWAVPVGYAQALSVNGYEDVMDSAGDHRHDRKLIRSIMRGGEDSGSAIVTVTNVTEHFGEEDFLSSVERNVTLNLSIESDICGNKK